MTRNTKRRRWHDERFHSEQGRNADGIGNGIGIHRADLGRILPDSKGVGIMLNRKDVLMMIGTGVMIIIATEMMVWAITGEYAILR